MTIGASKIIVISGLPGVGKTQLVTAFLKKYAKDYKKVTWMNINSSNIQSMNDSIAVKTKTKIMKFIKLRTGFGDDDYLKKKILIYDNAVNRHEIDKCLENLNFDTKSSVMIITTQNSLKQEWRGMEYYHLDILLEDDAENLIVNQLQENVDYDNEEVKILVKTMGCLPLALQQAVSYILSKKISISLYLKIFSEDSQSLLSFREFEDFADYPYTVFENFKGIINDLKSKCDVFEIFGFLSYFVTDKIHINHLYILESDEKKLKNILNSLKKQSILEENEENVTIHVLVSLVSRIVLRVNKNVNVFEKICEFCFKVREKVKNKNSAINDVKCMIPYLNCVMLNMDNILSLESGDSFTNKVKHQYYEKFLDIIWKAYYMTGDFETTKNILLKYLSFLKEKYDGEYEENIEVSKINMKLAKTYCKLKDYTTANNLFEKILPIFARDLGVDHEETGHLLTYIADNKRCLKMFEESDRYFDKAYEVFEKKLGEDNTETASLLRLMAINKCEQRDYEKADILFKSSYKIQSNKLGEDHYRTAYVIYNWGVNDYCRGSHQDADEKFRKCLKVYKRVHGDDHYFTNDVVNYIKENKRKLGKNSSNNRD